MSLITWICTGSTPIWMMRCPEATSCAEKASVGNPNAAIAAMSRRPFSSVGFT